MWSEVLIQNVKPATAATATREVSSRSSVSIRPSSTLPWPSRMPYSRASTAVRGRIHIGRVIA